MSDNVKLGQIIGPDEPANRDAVHVAVLPVVADQDLSSGDRVGVRNGRASRRFQPHVGVVDPFLTDAVLVDQRCYVCLFPGTVTGLRHHWTHPGVDDAMPLAAPTVIGADLPTFSDPPPNRPPSLSRPQPSWRTETVLRLCEQMRMDDDYTALPALADALEEADYSGLRSDPVRLDELRQPMDKRQAQRVVATLYSPETAMAVEAMDRMVDRMQGACYSEQSAESINYAFLMAAGDKWLDGSGYTTEEGIITWSQALYGMHEQYWAAYYAITGRTPEEQFDVPFTCHC